LKKLIISDSILQYFNLRKKTYVKYNINNYIIKEILSQKELERELHLIAYYLSSMSPIERNYAIYNKKLLMIIWYFEKWESELQSIKEDIVKVLINYKTLKYFILIKKLIK